MPLNPTQAAMLGLLHDGTMIGGEINDMAQRWIGPYWTVTRSQVYRELPTLESEGYIKAGPVGSRNSVPYTITAAGKRAFQIWLKMKPSSDLLRNEVMLRVSFGRLHKGNALQDLLSWARDRHERAVHEITGRLREAQDEGMDYDVAALRFAVMYHQTVIGWLETVELPE